MSPSPPDRAALWRERLHLAPLPVESGWWAPLSRSELRVRHDVQEVEAHSSIYYLLDAERPINYWHRLAPDDIHVLVDGGPVEYVLVSKSGAVTRHSLGMRPEAGDEPVIVCPGGTTKALRLLDPTGFALIASVLTPAWAPDRVWFDPPAVPVGERPAWFDEQLVRALTSPDS